mgnify:FL=1
MAGCGRHRAIAGEQNPRGDAEAIGAELTLKKLGIQLMFSSRHGVARLPPLPLRTVTIGLPRLRCGRFSAHCQPDSAGQSTRSLSQKGETKIATNPEISGYPYTHADCGCQHDYLLPALAHELERMTLSENRAFDLGCGNGSVANWLATQGFQVAGVDPSQTGIAEANRAFPHLNLRVGSAYDPLVESFGTFPLMISLEVVEHVYAPRDYARCVHDLLEPGGYALVSTPYHGYLKNLALALTGKMDDHFTALWDHGHIKFWSPRTITRLFEEAGLEIERIHCVGRIPQFAKSMIVVARRK